MRVQSHSAIRTCGRAILPSISSATSSARSTAIVPPGRVGIPLHNSVTLPELFCESMPLEGIMLRAGLFARGLTKAQHAHARDIRSQRARDVGKGLRTVGSGDLSDDVAELLIAHQTLLSRAQRL